jgi:hypothetical protein
MKYTNARPNRLEFKPLLLRMLVDHRSEQRTCLL